MMWATLWAESWDLLATWLIHEGERLGKNTQTAINVCCVAIDQCSGAVGDCLVPRGVGQLSQDRRAPFPVAHYFPSAAKGWKMALYAVI